MSKVKIIEYSYSSSLKKYSVRTKGIILEGRGVVQHHAENEGKPYNVYAVSRSAFERFSAEHPQMTLLID